MNQSPSNDRSDPDAIRQSFRVPVMQEDGIHTVINDKTYSVVDINPGGISVTDKDDTSLSQNQIIKNCRLNAPDESITGLTACVVHCTPTPEGIWNIGLKWIDVSDDEDDKLISIFMTIKQRLRKSSRD